MRTIRHFLLTVTVIALLAAACSTSPPRTVDGPTITQNYLHFTIVSTVAKPQAHPGLTLISAGQNAYAVLRVHSDACVTVQSITVAVRDNVGRNLDFPGAKSNVQICPSGYTFQSGIRSFPAATYTVFGSTKRNGVYTNLPSKPFIVRGTVPSTTTTTAPGSTTTTSTTVIPTTTTVPPATTTTTVAPGNTVLFDDEFNGTNVDLTKWRPNWLGSSDTAITKPINGAELSCYDPQQSTESGGFLHLKAVQRSCNGFGYASGLVESDGHFTFYTGYLEARVFLPGTSNITDWPAVWTNGTGTWPNTGESDIMEGLGGKACFHYHSPSGGPGGCASGNFAGWHTYAENVVNGTTTYFYDGVKVGSESNVNAVHFIILNLAVSSSIAPPVVAPAEMLVDYVRVYQKQP